MKTTDIYFSIYIVILFVIIKCLLLLLGLKHFYRATSNADNIIYIRNLLEDITVLGFAILFILFLR